MPVILIKFPHGLGDCVQLSVILKHLRKLRPGWEVDVKCGRGKHTALIGLCRRVYHDQEDEPQGPYDTVIDVGFYENYNNYPDRPNSKVTNCLHEVFGLNYEPSLGRYECAVPDAVTQKVRRYLERDVGVHGNGEKYPIVVIHYEGNTSATKKNLAHWQAQAMCDMVQRAGRVPILLDWDRRSPLPDQERIFNPGCGVQDLWGGFGSGDAATIAALMRQAEAVVGIDSGPGKIASTTDTPALICWRGLHPIQFHDPAPNTIHLIPQHHRRIPPCTDRGDIADYFERHYQYRTYEGEHGLVCEVLKWLCETLKVEDKHIPPIMFVTPNGIGDVMWALLKIRDIAKERPIDIALSGDPNREIDNRAVPFVKRFPFVRSVKVVDIPVLQDKERRTNSRGRYDYVSDGIQGNFHFLVPNRPLEDGRRIEDWLPEFKTDWGVINEFSWDNTERGAELGRGISPFVAFYLGPESGNVDEGHNRGFLWEPKHWVALGKEFSRRGLRIAVVGASYDRSYWERYVRDGVGEANMKWIDMIGQMEIGETLAFLREARLFISYQCGLAILAHYLGQKVITWWRPENDSCHPSVQVTFAESMKDAWTNPEYKDRYYGAIYRRETPGDLLAMIDQKGWLS